MPRKAVNTEEMGPLLLQAPRLGLTSLEMQQALASPVDSPFKQALRQYWIMHQVRRQLIEEMIFEFLMMQQHRAHLDKALARREARLAAAAALEDDLSIDDVLAQYPVPEQLATILRDLDRTYLAMAENIRQQVAADREYKSVTRAAEALGLSSEQLPEFQQRYEQALSAHQERLALAQQNSQKLGATTVEAKDSLVHQLDRTASMAPELFRAAAARDVLNPSESKTFAYQGKELTVDFTATLRPSMVRAAARAFMALAMMRSSLQQQFDALQAQATERLNALHAVMEEKVARGAHPMAALRPSEGKRALEEEASRITAGQGRRFPRMTPRSSGSSGGA